MYNYIMLHNVPRSLFSKPGSCKIQKCYFNNLHNYAKASVTLDFKPQNFLICDNICNNKETMLLSVAAVLDLAGNLDLLVPNV